MSVGENQGRTVAAKPRTVEDIVGKDDYKQIPWYGRFRVKWHKFFHGIDKAVSLAREYISKFKGQNLDGRVVETETESHTPKPSEVRRSAASGAELEVNAENPNSSEGAGDLSKSEEGENLATDEKPQGEEIQSEDPAQEELIVDANAPVDMTAMENSEPAGTEPKGQDTSSPLRDGSVAPETEPPLQLPPESHQSAASDAEREINTKAQEINLQGGETKSGQSEIENPNVGAVGSDSPEAIAKNQDTSSPLRDSGGSSESKLKDQEVPSETQAESPVQESPDVEIADTVVAQKSESSESNSEEPTSSSQPPISDADRDLRSDNPNSSEEAKAGEGEAPVTRKEQEVPSQREETQSEQAVLNSPNADAFASAESSELAKTETRGQETTEPAEPLDLSEFMPESKSLESSEIPVVLQPPARSAEQEVNADDPNPSEVAGGLPKGGEGGVSATGVGSVKVAESTSLEKLSAAMQSFREKFCTSEMMDRYKNNLFSILQNAVLNLGEDWKSLSEESQAEMAEFLNKITKDGEGLMENFKDTIEKSLDKMLADAEYNRVLVDKFFRFLKTPKFLFEEIKKISPDRLDNPSICLVYLRQKKG